MLGLLSGNQCFFLFRSHSEDEIGRMSATGGAVLLKFDLENYIKSLYYSNYPIICYFGVQFLKLKCTSNAKKHNQKCIEMWEKEKSILIEKKDVTKDLKKMEGAKEGSYRDPEWRRQYINKNYQENPE